MTNGQPDKVAVREIWHYPVKSMAGIRLDSCDLTEDGFLGDRGWAVRDEKKRCIADARSLPALLDIEVRYTRPPSPDEASPPVELRLPGGRTVTSGDDDVHDALSEHLGLAVTLWPRLPEDQRDHYLRAYPEDITGYLTDLFGVTDPADLPDISKLPPALAEFQTIPGSYFDAFPVHLVTTGTLDALSAAVDRPVDPRRLRPNLVVEGPSEAEEDWTGHELLLGDAVLHIETPCPRCVMISHPRHDLPADRPLLRTVHRDFAHNVGYYASVVKPGRITAD